MRNTKLFKFVMMSVMLCTASAAFASSASALTTNGPGTFSATAGTSRLVVTPPSPGTPFAITCTDTRASGSLIGPGPYTPAVNLTPTGLTLTFNSCTAVGNPAVVSCTSSASTLWATANPSAGITPGEVRGVSCQITFPSFPNCRITVSPTNGAGTRVVSGQYANPTSTTPGRLTVFAANQALTAQWSTISGGSCPFLTPTNGTGTAQFGAPGSPISNLVYTVTSAFVPVIS